MRDFVAANLDKLSTLTKYPSIPTYHALGERGMLASDEPQVDLSGDVIVTEKIDGTNGRIVVFPDGTWLIGSREEWLAYSGDLLCNDQLGIVTALRPIADYLCGAYSSLTVYYLEVYGGKTTAAAKEYSRQGTVGVRLFDVLQEHEWEQLVATQTREALAGRRDRGEPRFMGADELAVFAERVGPATVPVLDASWPVPTHPRDVWTWLIPMSETRAHLDGGGTGRSEGVVVRSPDRSRIAKIRFADYRRAVSPSR